ncbi:hypothetical protein [uncultured Erythrobacter sp.]|uniref:hypothetical protein n=1 Tax=uncultured Erythrobacter sp. TaxID=263913 RepID=UPI0026065E49|nr:hypothetical protein [uncultured Erythrobacter sp.]
MRFDVAASLAIIVILVGGSVWLSSNLDRMPRTTAAVAAAMRVHSDLPILIEAYADPVAREEDRIEHFSVCLRSSEPIDFERLNDLFADTVVRSVPVQTCRSERGKSETPMFTHFTHWFDQRGERAWHLVVSQVDCRSSKQCSVKLDDWHRGQLYVVEEIEGVWTVIDTDRHRIPR